MTTHCVTGAGGGDKPLLKQYHGKVEIPDDLYRTYERFAKALKAGDRGALETMCLPRSVQITTTSRPWEFEDRGSDINLPFATKKFQAPIAFCASDKKGIFGIRTATTNIWFVETRHSGWMAYKYDDANYDDPPTE